MSYVTNNPPRLIASLMRLLTLLALLAGLLPTMALARSGQRPALDGEDWSPGFHFDGFYDPLGVKIEAMAEDEAGNIYVAGRFAHVGKVAANNIAKWDGASWIPLGAGTDAEISALAIAPDGTLYAGGSFTLAGGEAASHVAAWDGTGWAPLGAGANATVRALAVDSGGTLYAGGDFTSAGDSPRSYLASWDGLAWAALGSGVDNSVTALAVDSANALYVVGDFLYAGASQVNHVARWDGLAWSALGTGIASYNGVELDALVVAPDNTVYLGGQFGLLNNEAANNIVKWNGSTWENLGNGLNAWTRALALGADGMLYASGDFFWSGNLSLNRIARWDGSAWYALGAGLSTSSRALLVDSSGVLYTHDDIYLATWTNAEAGFGGTWSRVSLSGTPGAGTDGPIHSLLQAPDGSLYAAGVFAHAGRIKANNIARWDGLAWHALGGGTTGVVHALAIGPSGTLYVGGEFHGAGSRNVSNLATWNGNTWGRIAPYLNGPVRALAVAPDGTLYAGGEFTQAGTLTASHVVKWTGGDWQALGTGTNGPVTALEVTSDGTLYVGGDFTQAGGLATGGLAIWDGTGWSPFINQSPSGLRDMARDDDTVYAVSDTALYVRQGGTSQTFPFDGASITVLAVAPDGVLYAGGYFDGTSASTTRHIARWNGVTWQPFSTQLGPDAQIDVKALALVADDELYVGGQLTTAGSTAASYIAHWGSVPITGLTIIGDGTVVVGRQKGLSATLATGNNVHYTWDFGDGSAPAHGATQSHSYSAAGSYTAVVTASNYLGTQVATTTVAVTNAAPVASAGLDQWVGPEALVTLDGSASDDPDGHTPLSYAWTQLAGPTVSLSDATSASPTFSAPRVGGVLVFRLVVTDAYGLMSTPDEVLVRAAPVSRVWLPLLF